MKTLLIRWLDGGVRGYIDYIPESWLGKDGRYPAKTHIIQAPTGEMDFGKCDLEVRGDESILDYRPYDQFNRDRADLGILRLRFSSTSRAGHPLVFWKKPKKPRFSRRRVETRRSWIGSPAIPTLAVNFPSYKGSSPFSKPTRNRPPTLSDLKRAYQPNDSPRQRWFEKRLLAIAKAIGSKWIPWRFRTWNGNEYELDRGAVGHAIANRFLALPGRNAGLKTVTIIARPVDKRNKQASFEAKRLKRLASYRSHQYKFSRELRRLYGDRCALSGCAVAETLQAAHIRTVRGADDNDVANGILLRADLHALLDAGLMTFTADGKRMVSSVKLRNKAYLALLKEDVFRPSHGVPSLKNIRWHRAYHGFGRKQP